MQYILNFIIEDALDEEDELNFMLAITINLDFLKLKLQSQVIKPNNKAAIDKYSKLLSYVLNKHKSVNKIAIFLKQILKQKLTLAPIFILSKRRKL